MRIATKMGMNPIAPARIPRMIATELLTLNNLSNFLLVFAVQTAIYYSSLTNLFAQK